MVREQEVFDAARRETLGTKRTEIDEFNAMLKQQPGRLGVLAIDAGWGRLVTVGLWETQAHEQAADQVLRPTAERLFGPIVHRVVAQGNVRHSDFGEIAIRQA